MLTQPPRDSRPSFVATIGKGGSAQFISTMLTVLAQMPPFVSANSEWTCGHPEGPGCPHVVPDRGGLQLLRIWHWGIT
jgi:hypothetical protein